MERWYHMSEKEIWKIYEEKIKNLWDIVEGNPKFKGKLKGAITANLVAELIKNYLGEDSDYKVSGNNVFIKGYATEFDLLILKKDASPVETGYPVYHPEDVKAIIECKATGIFFSSKEEKNPLEKELETFKQIRKKYGTELCFGYFTMQEQIPKRKTSIDFLSKTNIWINDYLPTDKQDKSVFCVANNDSVNPKIYKNSYSFEDWIENLIL